MPSDEPRFDNRCEGASSILNCGESLEVSTTASAVAVANQMIRHLHDL